MTSGFEHDAFEPDVVDTGTGSHEALIEFLYQTPVGLVRARPDGEITMINPMSAQLLMPFAPHGDLSNLFDVLAEVAPDLRGRCAAPCPLGTVICDGLQLRLADADVRGRSVQLLALRLLKLDADTLIASLVDITADVRREEQRLAERLHDAARIDLLTSMPTRSVALERIEAALRRSRDDANYLFAVLFINCDRFSRVNVTLGQAAGDGLLRQIADRLNGTVRPHDAVARASGPEQTAARLGGDEFVVVLEGLRSADHLAGVAQRLVDTLCKPYFIDGDMVHATASIGVVAGASRTGDADAVLQDARLAMRDAKRGGGARHRFFEPPMKELARRRGSLEAELRQGLDQGQLYVVYQPIVGLAASDAADGPATGALVGVEALVRWRHPTRGTVSPIEFIDIAEETGLIGPLGAFVMGDACRRFAAWQARLGELAPRILSVNVSRAQLREPGLVEQVRATLRASGLAAGCLQLEVTESLAAQDAGIQSRLHELKQLGLTLALDDFGTGYSSLASLHQMPIDVVKIDRSFVSQLETSEHHRVLVEATVRVARSLGMRTVAEGIETAEQAAILANLRCDKGQGYLYARPLTPEQLVDWLMSRAPAA